MATTTVFLRKVNTRVPEQPLNVRFRHGAAGKCELVISTGYQILPAELKNARVTGEKSREINDLLHTIQSDLMQAYEYLEQSQEPIVKTTMQAEYQRVKSAREAREKSQRQEVLQADNQAGKAAIDSRLREGQIQQEIQQLQSQLENQRAETKAKAAAWKETSRKANIPDLAEELTPLMVETGLIQPVPTAQDLLVTYFAKYIERNKHDLSTSSERIYRSIARVIHRFNPDLKIQNVDAECLYQLQNFMLSEGKVNSSVKAYMGKVKTVLNTYAFDLNLSHSYKQFKDRLVDAKDKIVFLHPRQLHDLMTYQKPKVYNPNQPNRTTPKGYDRAVDILLFLVSTGLRWSDAFRNFRELIRTKQENGQQLQYIEIMPKKTEKKGIVCEIPVTKLMKQILERHNYQFKRMEDDHFHALLREFCQDIPSFQQTYSKTTKVGRETQKEDLKLCDTISSHIGRKTFISYQFALGHDIPTIIGRSGHTEVNTLMIYAQKTENIAEQVKALDFYAKPDPI
ncbi:phage integrase SAM-like domain-containing protein [Hymenobacter sp. AT01-02]|uniref:phage integrase SAM-like domain-containing protein n=1 Tax=Hymenobacter sp. AT01-02 TaxID=1571877 RepID=UPI0005F0FEC0|nr:phage integrase SAM-like domain-containing protein [Hymenobacter sp. AT01-02]